MKYSYSIIIIILVVILVAGYTELHKSMSNPEFKTASSSVPIITQKDSENNSTSTKVSNTGTRLPPKQIPPKNEYHFGGVVNSIETHNGILKSEVTQKNSWYDAGLYKGDKGNITIQNLNCDIKVHGFYSFVVTYDITSNEYMCESAKMAFYD